MGAGEGEPVGEDRREQLGADKRGPVGEGEAGPVGVDHVGPVGEDGGGLVCADQGGPVGLDHRGPICSDCKRVRARLQLAVKVLQTRNTYMSDIITIFINKFDHGVGRIKKKFQPFYHEFISWCFLI